MRLLLSIGALALMSMFATPAAAQCGQGGMCSPGQEGTAMSMPKADADKSSCCCEGGCPCCAGKETTPATPRPFND